MSVPTSRLMVFLCFRRFIWAARLCNPNKKRTMDRVLVLVFSKDRPLQLHGCLTSLFHHLRHPPEQTVHVSVLTRGCSKEYVQVRKAFGTVTFVEEHDFHKDVRRLLSNPFYHFVSFVVDDTVFVRPFDLGEITRALHQYKKALGFSLRLGSNTTFCYMLQQHHRCHLLTESDTESDTVRRWDWTKSTGDFAYPVELSSSVYRWSDVHLLLSRISAFVNPSTLESALDAFIQRAQHPKVELLSFPTSVAFSIPMNLTQTSWQNRHSGLPAYSMRALLKRFQNGQRMDVKQLYGYIPESCHEVVPFGFI